MVIQEEQVEELFKKKFPNGNFYLRVNNLTEIKRNGVYVSGATSERSITGIDKGDRAGWLKKHMVNNLLETILK